MAIKISIITVCYNSAATIAQTIDSVLRQTYPEVEFIIIDGASTDYTADVVKSFGRKISHFVSEPDNGIYDAMNKGIQKATGDVIGILNADDFYAADDILQKVVTIFETTDAELVYGDLHYVKQYDTNIVTRKWKAGAATAKSFYRGWMPPHPTVFVRRALYEKAGLFNTSFKSAADYEMMLRLFLKHQCRAAYLPVLMVKMRAGGVSNLSLKNRLRANGEDAAAWKVNNLKPQFFTIILKPLRKIGQFFIR